MELIDLANSVRIFLSQIILLVCLTFLLGSLTVTFTVLLFWIFSSDARVCSAMAFPPLENSNHVVVSVSINFSVNSMHDALFPQLRLCICWWGWFLRLFEKCSMGGYLKFSASAAASELWGWVQVGTDVYIPHRKYQIKPHSFLWFSAARVAVHRNHFFRLYQQNKSFESKVKFRQTSCHCKRVLEAAKLAYAIKTKETITSQKLGSWDF